MTAASHPAPGRDPAGFQVLARRYRPQSFSQVVGQDPIVRTLTNAVESDRVAHAYLFCGTRGIGKTTMARLLAKALNCESGPTSQPCNQCASCREIAAGRAVDVLEIDGASHNRVDDVRDLQESLSYQPVRDRRRVVIIDEVHMLSRSAFNALLKILEEPPVHVVFVLATTEFDKIPGTILSRCQHFRFRRIRRQDLIRQLEQVASAEKIQLERPTLALVARQASGSLRDALSALDQLVSFCGTSIDPDAAEALLGALPPSRVDDLLRSVAAQDAPGALRALQVSEERGDDPFRFAEALLARLRDLSVLRAAGKDTDLVDADPEERQALLELTGSFAEDDLVRLFQMAAQLEPTLRHTRHPRTLLELTALKMVHATGLTPLADLVTRLGGGAPGGTGDRAPAPSAPPALPRKAAPPPRPTDALRARPAPRPGGLDMDRLRAAVEEKRPAVAAFLEHAEGSLDGDRILLSFRPRHSFFKKSVDLPANRAALEAAAERTLGRKVEIRLELAEREKGPPPPPAETPQHRRERLLEQAGGQKAVRAVAQIFGAQIADIQPLDPGSPTPPPENEP
ncbi:MAG: DNA polymerase III subunit gamma/tau [Acidobacteriota bacterium]